MKTLYFFLIFWFFITDIKAQVNLVPNPSFEEYNNCPTGSQTNLLVDWDLNYNSSDFFHQCSPFNFGVPQNVMGDQCASTGNGYAGLHFYALLPSIPNSLDVREYIGGELIAPLIPGIKYYVSFKTSLANSSNCANNNIGIKLTTLNLVDSNSYTFYGIVPPPFINNFSHINYPNIIANSVEWTTIRGSFIADSSYVNFLIGDFFTTSMTDSIILQGNQGCQSYYYLDDVCISTDSLFCENVKKQVINISADSTAITQNTCINFTLQTPINYTAYEWHFEGGFPSTSNQMNPSNVCYPNVGNYDVTFIGHKNGGCTDTIYMSDYINVYLIDALSNIESKLIQLKVYQSENKIYILNNLSDNDYKIHDIMGREVLSGKVNSSKTNIINCNTFIAGSYILSISNSLIKPIKFIINSNSN